MDISKKNLDKSYRSQWECYITIISKNYQNIVRKVIQKIIGET